MEKFTTSNVKEPEWQVGFQYEHPDLFGEHYIARKNYSDLLEDSVYVLTGKCTHPMIPLSSSPKIYVAVQVTYNKEKRFVKDIQSLLENDVKNKRREKSK